jgi:hypothetical protein
MLVQAPTTTAAAARVPMVRPPMQSSPLSDLFTTAYCDAGDGGDGGTGGSRHYPNGNHGDDGGDPGKPLAATLLRTTSCTCTMVAPQAAHCAPPTRRRDPPPSRCGPLAAAGGPAAVPSAAAARMRCSGGGLVRAVSLCLGLYPSPFL